MVRWPPVAALALTASVGCSPAAMETTDGGSPADLTVDVVASGDLSQSSDLLSSPVIVHRGALVARRVLAGDFILAAKPPEGSWVAVVETDPRLYPSGPLHVVDDQATELATSAPPSLGICYDGTKQFAVAAGERLYFIDGDGDLVGWWPQRPGGQPLRLAHATARMRSCPLLSPDERWLAWSQFDVESQSGSVWFGSRDGPLATMPTGYVAKMAFTRSGDLYFDGASYDIGDVRTHVVRVPAGGAVTDATRYCEHCRLEGLDETGALVATARPTTQGDTAEYVALSAAGPPSAQVVRLDFPPRGWRLPYGLIASASFIPDTRLIAASQGTAMWEQATRIFDVDSGRLVTDLGDGCGGHWAWMVTSHSWIACGWSRFAASSLSLHSLDGTLRRTYENATLVSLLPSDRYVMVVATNSRWGYPDAGPVHLIVGLPGRPETLMPWDSTPLLDRFGGWTPTVVWLDDHRLLYVQGGELALLDASTWTSTVFSGTAGVSTCLHDPVHARLFYTISNRGAGDGLYVAPLP